MVFLPKLIILRASEGDSWWRLMASPILWLGFAQRGSWHWNESVSGLISTCIFLLKDFTGKSFAKGGGALCLPSFVDVDAAMRSVVLWKSSSVSVF